MCKHSIHSARLACVRHAASVHPEPGSNSLKDFFPRGIPSALTMKLTSLSRSVPRFPFYCRDCFRFSKTVKNFQVLVCVSLFSYQCAGSFFCARFFASARDIVASHKRAVNIFFVFSAPAFAGAYCILSPLWPDVNTCF